MPVADDHKKYILQLYAIALADEAVSKEELLFLNEFARRKGISENEIDQLLLNPEMIVPVIAESLPEKIELLYYAAGMVCADGKIDERELPVLKNCCSNLGFMAENCDDISAFMLEEVKKSTSLADIQVLVKLNMIQ